MKCCNDIAATECRYCIGFRVTDGLWQFDVTVFGQQLDLYFGCSASDFYRLLVSLSSAVFANFCMPSVSQFLLVEHVHYLAH